MASNASPIPRRPVVSFSVACLSVAGWLAAIPLFSEDSWPAFVIYAIVGCTSGTAFVYGVIGVGDARRERNWIGVATAVVGAVLGFLACFMSLFVISVLQDSDAWVVD